MFSFNRPKPMLAVSCLVLCAACLGEPFGGPGTRPGKGRP